MGLIDADALKAIRFHDLPYSQIVPTDCDTDDKVSAYKLGWNDAIDAIVESVPAVDHIKHGHWTDRAKSILGLPTESCSVCAEWSVGDNKNYCPNCGAKMDEVEDADT